MTIIDTQKMTPDMAEAIQRALAGEEILVAGGKLYAKITQVLVANGGKLYAKITQVVKMDENVLQKKRQFGFRKGALKYMSPDFNEPLNDFEDYMSSGSSEE